MIQRLESRSLQLNFELDSELSLYSFLVTISSVSVGPKNAPNSSKGDSYLHKIGLECLFGIQLEEQFRFEHDDLRLRVDMKAGSLSLTWLVLHAPAVEAGTCRISTVSTGITNQI